MNIYKDEENFKEALNHYYYVNKDKVNPLTPNLKFIFSLLEKYSLENLFEKSNTIMSIFFLVCKGLKAFYEKFNTLPVVGNIPDMTSDTDTYISLKKM